MRFVDQVCLTLASGNGGPGCISFLRDQFTRRGGPNGGDGGHGGDLIMVASRNRNTLVDFRRNRTYQAPNGRPGEGKMCNGAQGKDLILEVPVGTLVIDDETDEILADLGEEGDVYQLIGGKGGLGNIHFKSATRRTPQYAQPGIPGEEHKVRLELKLVADVGLLGLPNAGKSTFIGRVTASRSRVGAHRFTTITPQLGVVPLSNGQSFIIADMPGLIAGAADGVGLGHQFLRHVERCALYLHLLCPEDGDPLENFHTLNRELENYDPALLERPQFVILTKADTLDEDTRAFFLNHLKEETKTKIFTVSSVTGEGLVELIEAIWEVVQAERQSRTQRKFVIKRPTRKELKPKWDDWEEVEEVVPQETTQEDDWDDDDWSEEDE